MANLISKDKVLRCLKESSEQIDWGQSKDGDAFKHYVGANYRTIAEFKPEQPKWISVEDRLPPDDQRVIGYTPVDGYMFVGFHKTRKYTFTDASYSYSYWYIITSMRSTKRMCKKVTHWMPLPEPPKEVKQNG